MNAKKVLAIIGVIAIAAFVHNKMPSLWNQIFGMLGELLGSTA